MKLIKYLFIVIALFFVNSFNVNALECNSSDISNIKTIADKIDVVYEANDECGTSFKLSFINISEDFYIYDTKFGLLYSYFSVTDGKYTISFVDSGKHSFDIYSSLCNVKLRTISTNLYVKNKYASDELCKNNKNLDVCKESYNTCNMSHEEFVKIIENAKKNSSNSNNEKKEEVEETPSNSIIDYIKNYYLYIIGSIAIIIGIIIFIIRYKKKGVLD